MLDNIIKIKEVEFEQDAYQEGVKKACEKWEETYVNAYQIISIEKLSIEEYEIGDKYYLIRLQDGITYVTRGLYLKRLLRL